MAQAPVYAVREAHKLSRPMWRPTVRRPLNASFDRLTSQNSRSAEIPSHDGMKFASASRLFTACRSVMTGRPPSADLAFLVGGHRPTLNTSPGGVVGNYSNGSLVL